MKIEFTHKDGIVEVFNVTGPLHVIEADLNGTMDILHDEGTGIDYWFNKDGSFDGTGLSQFVPGELTGDEAKMLLQGLKEMHEGKTNPFRQIQDELNDKKKVN